MEKQDLSEINLLVETISRRSGLTPFAVEAVLDAARDLGWQLTKKRTAADVHLPRLQDFRMGGK